MALISVHFDGPITVDHKVPIRTLATTYSHLQRAIDRSFLIETYGDVYKHQRLTADQYSETVFFAEYPREGGIILDAMRAGAENIVDRIAASIRPVIEKALDQGIIDNKSLANQFRERENYVKQMGSKTQKFEDVMNDPPAVWKDAYSNRSVVKEIDQLVAQISPKAHEGSTVDIEIVGSRTHLPFKFDARTAKRFHKIASQKEIGAPMLVNCIIRSLDRGNRHTSPSAKIFNLESGREVTLLCRRENDADALHPRHNNEPVQIFASPFIEALGFDMMGGDLVFISIAQ